MTVSPSPVWVFADETGDVGRALGSSRYLIVAVVLTRNPRSLRKTVTKTRKHLRKKLRNVPELKAWHTPKKVVARFLRYIAELDVEIVAVVLDKHTASARPDSEDWYRLACAEAVRHCVERYAWLKLAVDRRYTNETLRDKLEQSIFVGAASTSERTTVGLIRIEQLDSVQEKGIQAADAVVWSLGQKYERGDDELYNIIKDKIIVEEVLKE